MFKRLLLEDYTVACLSVAFVTAATIFFGFAWRALRMSRAQVDRFAQLPFASDASERPAPTRPITDSTHSRS